jgi:hypothetical protein
MHFTNIKTLFCTSTLRWYFLFNWLIIHKEILSILNSLLIYNHTHMIMKNNEFNLFIFWVYLWIDSSEDKEKN